MKSRFPVFFALMAMLSFSSFAKPVDKATACKVATHFYAMKFRQAPESLTYTIEYEAPSLSGEKGSAPSFYVVNFNSEGFVIVAGDDAVQPVLAYSNEGAFIAENMPANVRFFLNGYTEEIGYMVNNQQSVDSDVQRQWQALLSDEAPAPKDRTVVVEPLLGNNKWAQTMYYNDRCPVDTTGHTAYGGHAAVGCGAIVMGQVMRYWRFPVTGTGARSYSSSRYGRLSANFGTTTYHYKNMPDEFTSRYHPDSCVDAVATLLYHCGVAVKMNYGPSASVANSNNIVSALSTYFGYPNTVQYIERGNASSTVWLNYLKGELDDGAPFMYGGSGNYGGHVWTCDGYQDNDYFHFNWGWGGQQNGYYALTNCSSYGFNSNHAIIIGIRGPELPTAVSGHCADEVKVFPNPSNGVVYVRAEAQPVMELQVFDISGKMLLRKGVNGSAFSVDLSTYAPGAYILRMVTEKGVKTSRIVKK
ncbi:MAG: thiol protease/hemagglutinin PrtT [Bacteroidales bacterium]|nr:thiol protease/hemagglutinin PrtT [Bacteroidales bacterium]